MLLGERVKVMNLSLSLWRGLQRLGGDGDGTWSLAASYRRCGLLGRRSVAETLKERYAHARKVECLVMAVQPQQLEVVSNLDRFD